MTMTDMAQRPEVSLEERRVQEVTKHIKKLRWMGMEDEARREIVVLRQLRSATVLTGPRDTD